MRIKYRRKWTNFPHWPMMPHRQLLRSLNTRKQHTHYAARSETETETVQVTTAVFSPSALTLFCEESSLICDPIYFSWLFFNNFLFAAASNNCTGTFRGGRVDFPVLCFSCYDFFVSQTIVTWSAGASLLHIWIQLPHWKMGKDVPLTF